MSESWSQSCRSQADIVFNADIVYDESEVNCEDSCGKCADLTYGDCSICTVVCEGQKGDPGERGPRGGDCYCESQFGYFGGVFSYPSPNLYSYEYDASAFPGVLLDVQFIDPVECPLTDDFYNGWSLSYDQPGSTTVDSYTGNAIAILDPFIGDTFQSYQACGGAAQANVSRLPAVLFILNNIERYSTPPAQGPGYSASDIQSAIWTLLYTASPRTDPIIVANPITGVILPAPTPANVRVIINQALDAQTRYEATGELSEIAPNCINGLVLFAQSSVGCLQIIVIAVSMCDLVRCTPVIPPTVLLKLSNDTTVTIPITTDESPYGLLIEPAGPDSPLLIGGWVVEPPSGYVVPTTGNYKIWISASFAFLDEGVPTLVSVGMTVNGTMLPATIGSVQVNPNSISSNLSVVNTIPLAASDIVNFYAIANGSSDIISSIFIAFPEPTGPQPWFRVVLELIAEP